MGFWVDATVVEGQFLCFDSLMLTVFPKLTFREVVFLMLLQQVGAWALHCGLLVSIRGAQKVTVLVVFLTLPWEGGVDTAMLSTQEVAARLGTL